MINANIHDVNEISLGEVNKLSNTNVYTRKITVKTKDGEGLEITCFADRKKDLVFEVKGAGRA